MTVLARKHDREAHGALITWPLCCWLFGLKDPIPVVENVFDAGQTSEY
jgi:hypothetical protein